MEKKWLIAVFVGKRDNILQVWRGQVSYDVTDVTVPENTIFYFFSTCENPNLEVTQWQFLKNQCFAWISEIKGLVHEGKLYIEGRENGESIVLENTNCTITLNNFMEFAKESNLLVELV